MPRYQQRSFDDYPSCEYCTQPCGHDDKPFFRARNGGFYHDECADNQVNQIQEIRDQSGLKRSSNDAEMEAGFDHGIQRHPKPLRGKLPDFTPDTHTIHEDQVTDPQFLIGQDDIMLTGSQDDEFEMWAPERQHLLLECPSCGRWGKNWTRGESRSDGSSKVTCDCGYSDTLTPVPIADVDWSKVKVPKDKTREVRGSATPLKWNESEARGMHGALEGTVQEASGTLPNGADLYGVWGKSSEFDFPIGQITVGGYAISPEEARSRIVHHMPKEYGVQGFSDLGRDDGAYLFTDTGEGEGWHSMKPDKSGLYEWNATHQVGNKSSHPQRAIEDYFRDHGGEVPHGWESFGKEAATEYSEMVRHICDDHGLHPSYMNKLEKDRGVNEDILSKVHRNVWPDCDVPDIGIKGPKGWLNFGSCSSCGSPFYSLKIADVEHMIEEGVGEFCPGCSPMDLTDNVNDLSGETGDGIENQIQNNADMLDVCFEPGNTMDVSRASGGQNTIIPTRGWFNDNGGLGFS